MSEYWKSTGKKYCDFCKCWTADNKASIDFHERGKNHQANVERRLREIKKNSIDKRKKDETSKRMFEQMEKAALAAVQKDISQNDVSVGKSDLKNIVSAHSSDSNQGSKTYPWTAMTAPQGFTYYYNALTGESSWTMPEVFKQLEQEKKKEKEDKEYKAAHKVEKNSQGPCQTKDPYRKQKESPPPVEELRNIHPLLGGWSTIKHIETDQQQDDILPENKQTSSTASTDPEQVNVETTGETTEKERTSGKKFKEKVIKTNLVTTDEPVSFKKRKTKVRNMRKRDDDD